MENSMNMDSNTSKRLLECTGSSDRSPKKIKTESTEESHFVRLFEEAVEIMQRYMNLSEEDLERGIETVIAGFRYHLKAKYSDIDFSKSENLCAYFYRFSALSAGLTNNKILDAVNKCEEFRHCLQSSTLNVVIVGSGAGSEIVGLCSALHGNTICESLKLTLIDSVKRWASFFNIIEFLLRESNFGNASNVFKNINICTSFMREDVSRDLIENSDYYCALKDADIILVKNLLSILSCHENNKIAQNIVGGMKTGAIVLLLDSQYYHFQGLSTIYSSRNDHSSDYNLSAKPGKIIGKGISSSSKAQITVMIKRATDSPKK